MSYMNGGAIINPLQGLSEFTILFGDEKVRHICIQLSSTGGTCSGRCSGEWPRSPRRSRSSPWPRGRRSHGTRSWRGSPCDMVIKF